MHIYTLYDKKTRTYNRPFFETADVISIRNLKMEVNRQDPANPLYMFPEDYELYRIGSFDPNNGGVAVQPPELIATASSCVKDPSGLSGKQYAT